MPLPSSGVFYFIFKMYGVHVESKNGNQNSRCWQDILTLIFDIIYVNIKSLGQRQN